MTPVRKYHLFTLLVLVLGFYLLLTEVTERWTTIWDEYTSLNDKRAKVLDPEAAHLRKQSLHEEIVTLRASLTASSGRVEQSEPGTIETIAESAKRSGIVLETLSPGKPAEGNVMSFTAEAAGQFHGIGKFINQIENSPIAMRLEKLDLQRESGHILKARLNLRATILSEKVKK